MKRPWHIWLSFGTSLALVAAAVGWLSLRALHAERAELEARREAGVEENVRLALWRMDSALSVFLAQENARPFEAYLPPVASPNRDRTDDTDQPRESERLRESARPGLRGSPTFNPTATAEMNRSAPRAQRRMGPSVSNAASRLARGMAPKPPQVRLYFQALPDGRFTSPETTLGFNPDDDRPSAEEAPRAELAPVRLVELRNLTSYQNLLRELPSTVAESASVLVWSNELEPAPIDRPLLPTINQQRVRNADEFRNRSQVLSQNSIVGNNAGNGFNGVEVLELEAGPVVSPVVGILTPIVSGSELILARQARADGQTSIQGAWLDWPVLRRELLAQVGDLLPAARLEIAGTDSGGNDEGRRLALLPIRLAPEATVVDPPGGISPVRLSLITAWGAMFLAAAAVAALLAGVVTLSERRADFVSAVTHELRTPLTTFRMYVEMLSSGMVHDEAMRRQYLETLQTEADRLTHLVENVLAYARLERGGLGNRIQAVTGKVLLSAATERLAQRAAQADFEWKTELDAGAAEARVLADPSAVEQILFNLVDNACKYAATARDRILHLEATVTDGAFVIRLTDHGPGFSTEQRRRLFQPFRKPATEAARTAPGVGLGLSLSRRLARDMGGDLRLDPTTSAGATLELVLRLAPP